MGRAFGVFLLVVGIGLAAYGLPSSDSGAPGVGLPPQTAERGSIDALTPAVPSSRLVPTAEQATAASVTPMDKLRAAAQNRFAATESSGSLQTLSQTATPDKAPPVPRPIELAPALQTRPPSVVTAARRETSPTKNTATKDTAVAAKGGWSTQVTVPPATSPPLAQQAGLPAPTRLTSISIAPTTLHAGQPTVSSVAKPAPAADPQPVRRQVAQRPVPPVYLGRTSTSSGGNSGGGGGGNNSGGGNGGSSRSAFRSQDMWESSRRSGM